VDLIGAAGLRACVITLGAAVQSLAAPDREGRLADVVLGFPTLDGYLASAAYMGVTVGRVANRIAGGRVELEGREHRIPLNDGAHALHGGQHGLDRRVWEIIELRDGAAPGVTLRCVSSDGDQGLPGELTMVAHFDLTADGELALEYEATTDRPTPVNLTSHVYWNLAGEGSSAGAMDHLLMLSAEEFLPTDAAAIPTGEFRPVNGTPFDFRRPTPIGLGVRDASEEQIVFGRGYDHNWVVSREPSSEPRLVAVLEDPLSGRVMELSTDQPGLQMYSGNFLDATTAGKSGRLYRQGDAVVLEPQMFPDAPNQPSFGSIRLEPGQVYRNRIRFRFFTR